MVATSSPRRPPRGVHVDPRAQPSAPRANHPLAFASSRIGSRSVDVRYDEFSDKFFCSFSQVRDDDVSKVTLPAWPGQGYGRHWLSSGLLVQFVSCPYSDVFDLLYDLDPCIVYLYLDSLESLL
nr:uncharacterized protein LOC127296861 isoform X1 [Lolium perenne]XP_051183049.1 uncharacterized protein LOC127296861 isoform X2 [Lolium perenne]XP_051183050.1 uncharacterized protein LOC127296861 isoform X3 [Lolium perenne]